MAVGLEILGCDAELFLGDVEDAAWAWRPGRFQYRSLAFDAARRAWFADSIKANVWLDIPVSPSSYAGLTRASREGRHCASLIEMAGSSPAMTIKWSCETRTLFDVGGCGPFCRAHFRPIGLHARELEAAIGADHGDAIAFDCNDLADLAGDALGIFRGQRRGFQNFQLRAVDRCPRSGRRTAASDQAVDLLPWLTEIDARIVRAAAAFICRLDSSCLMRGALPAFTRSTDSIIASTPIGNSRSK